MSTERITGSCQSVEIKSGWHKFNIDVGTKYPISLSTKKQSLIEQATAVGEKVCDWVFTAKDSDKVNENTGKPYVNRWLEEVHETDGTTQTQQTASAGASPRPQQASPPDATRVSIERQTIVKAALPLYPVKLITSDEEFFDLLGKLERFCGGTVAVEDQAAVAAAGGVDPDDIPF